MARLSWRATGAPAARLHLGPHAPPGDRIPWSRPADLARAGSDGPAERHYELAMVGGWIETTHTVAAITLFSSFTVCSPLVLSQNSTESRTIERQNTAERDLPGGRRRKPCQHGVGVGRATGWSFDLLARIRRPRFRAWSLFVKGAGSAFDQHYPRCGQMESREQCQRARPPADGTQMSEL